MGGELTDELIRPLLYANVYTMDHYVKDIGLVAGGTIPPDFLDALD